MLAPQRDYDHHWSRTTIRCLRVYRERPGHSATNLAAARMCCIASTAWRVNVSSGQADETGHCRLSGADFCRGPVVSRRISIIRDERQRDSTRRSELTSDLASSRLSISDAGWFGVPHRAGMKKSMFVPIDTGSIRGSLRVESRAGLPRLQRQCGSLPPVPVEVGRFHV